MVNQVWHSLREADSTLPATCNTQWRWHEEFLAGGYGVASTESSAAINVGGESGLKLENTYSGKAFAAALALTKQQQEPVLFWQTFARGRE
jgi:D-cysteine desulfhydrase